MVEVQMGKLRTKARRTIVELQCDEQKRVGKRDNEDAICAIQRLNRAVTNRDTLRSISAGNNYHKLTGLNDEGSVDWIANFDRSFA